MFYVFFLCQADVSIKLVFVKHVDLQHAVTFGCFALRQEHTGKRKPPVGSPTFVASYFGSSQSKPW